MGGKTRAKSRRTFFLEPVPPFRLDFTVWTLRRRPENAVDRWDGQTYCRVLSLSSAAVELAVTQVSPPEAPRLRVTVRGAPLNAKLRLVATSALERLLGLRTDLRDFYRVASLDERLRHLSQRFRGMKPPRFPTVFESMLNAIACQQMSLTVGILLLNRLVENFGLVAACDGCAHAFPRPEDIAGLKPETLRALGFSRQKAQYILDLACSVVTGQLDPESLATLPDAAALENLGALRGIGRWSAEYVLLRGLGRFHVFPGDDVGGATICSSGSISPGRSITQGFAVLWPAGDPMSD